MFDDEQKKLISSVLGLITLSGGLIFSLLPRLAGRSFGIKRDDINNGNLMTLRALGFRDIAFGLGLLTIRSEAKSRQLWLRLFSVCMVGDVIACSLALRKSGTNFLTLTGAVASVVFGAVAWIAAQDKKK